MLANYRFDVRQGGFAIDLWFALAEEVQVRAIEEENLHRGDRLGAGAGFVESIPACCREQPTHEGKCCPSRAHIKCEFKGRLCRPCGQSSQTHKPPAFCPINRR